MRTVRFPTDALRFMKEIPLNDLVRLHAPIQDEIDAVLVDVARSGRYINGPMVEQFESDFGAFLGFDASHVVSCSNGTDAILMALMAAGIGPGDRVAVPSFTFTSPAMSILRVGATPVFIDVEPDSYHIDLDALETHDVDAIIAVHLFGDTIDLVRLRAIADKKGCVLIEDAAQAVGARRGQLTGTVGDFSCFSFFPTKNLGALGDAGAVVAKDNDAAITLRAIRHHGATQKYIHDRVGGNFRMDAMQGAVLSIKLRHLERWNERRRAIASIYLENPVEPGRTFHRFVIEVDDRPAFRSRLAAAGIATAVYYPEPLHTMQAFRSAELGGPLPYTEEKCRRVVAVPLFPSMTDAEIEKVKEWL